MSATKKLFESTQESSDNYPKIESVYYTDSFWTSTTTRQINKALIKFHSSDLSIKKDKVVPVTANRTRAYTTLDEIISKVKPILCNCGILIHQHLAGNELITILTHESGEFIASKMTFQSMSGSNTNALQNAGGGLTYLRRYALTSILFINSENDDDGESSSITHSQITTLPSVSDTKLPQMLEYLKTGGDMETITSKYSLSYLQRKFLTDNLNKHKEESK